MCLILASNGHSSQIWSHATKTIREAQKESACELRLNLRIALSKTSPRRLSGDDLTRSLKLEDDLISVVLLSAMRSCA